LCAAVPTAEGAIFLAMERRDATLWRSKVLVVGWGRIGRVLAPRLAALGAEVAVSARRPGDLAEIAAAGMMPVPTENPAAWPEGTEILFNTVPAPVVTEDALRRLAPGALVLDLASDPGGTDFSAAQGLGVHATLEPGLPGRMAPCTAAAAIRDTVYHILQELE